MFVHRLEHVCLICGLSDLSQLKIRRFPIDKDARAVFPELGHQTRMNRFETISKCRQILWFTPKLDSDNYSWTKGSTHIIMLRRELWPPFPRFIWHPKSAVWLLKKHASASCDISDYIYHFKSFSDWGDALKEFQPNSLHSNEFFNYSSARNFPADSDSSDCRARIL